MHSKSSILFGGSGGGGGVPSATSICWSVASILVSASSRFDGDLGGRATGHGTRESKLC